MLDLAMDMLWKLRLSLKSGLAPTGREQRKKVKVAHQIQENTATQNL